ncbi:MAG: DUF3027 domain-containing protein [Jatrophihabitantaceae bacterium]
MNTSTESLTVDEAIAEAVEQARAAAVELAGADVGIAEAGGPSAQVGTHLGVRAEGPYAATHAFAATLPGYVGWHWAVTMVRVPDGPPSVAEVVLLPGEGALLPPPWVPWSERLQAGDLSPGDLLPPPPDDPRLVPGYTDSGDPQVEEVAFELGLGRVQVLSRLGRLTAADRWQSGDFGPDSPMARQAPGRCGTCGFFVALGGSLQAAFGVCANEFANADGRVVAVEYGCGAHSETVAEPAIEPAGPVYQDELIELVDLHGNSPGVAEAADSSVTGPVDTASASASSAWSASAASSAEPTADDLEQPVIDIEADTVQPVDEDQFADAGQGEYEPGGTQVGEVDPT